MQLLVSVADGAEAAAARDGGADIVDAKDPRHGALAPVTAEMFQAVARHAGTRRLSAALGDARDPAATASAAAAFARAGAAFVKLGFAGTRDARRVEALLQAARQAVRRRDVVAVAYADWSRVDAPSPAVVLAAAARAGVAGVLLDTGDKTGPGLRGLMPLDDVRAWVRDAEAHGLATAIAGQLQAADIGWACDTGAAILGVRTAACSGGRLGRVTSARVRGLVESIRRQQRDGDACRQRGYEIRVDQDA